MSFHHEFHGKDKVLRKHWEWYPYYTRNQQPDYSNLQFDWLQHYNNTTFPLVTNLIQTVQLLDSIPNSISILHFILELWTHAPTNQMCFSPNKSLVYTEELCLWIGVHSKEAAFEYSSQHWEGSVLLSTKEGVGRCLLGSLEGEGQFIHKDKQLESRWLLGHLRGKRDGCREQMNRLACRNS